MQGVLVGRDLLDLSRLTVDGTFSFEPVFRKIGTNTITCMQSGAIYGAAAMLDGMIERMEAELGSPCTVIATGGLAGCVIPHCHREIRYEPDLLLHGLQVIWDKNRK